MRVLISIVIMATSITGGFSQSKIIPPSPNAMAFQKYGDIPVSYHSGLPQISVPIYELKYRDITLPIELSYHASGIKVGDEASKVGLGWVLNVTGIISRNIIGGDDFDGGSQKVPYHQLPTDLLKYYAKNFGWQQQMQPGCEILLVNNQLKDYENYDTEPDHYFFNLPGGGSGKFILTRAKEAILEKDQKLEIKVFDDASGNDHANLWRIRTADGFTYEFKKYEKYIGNELIDETGHHKTAWYLTKIISPTLAEMDFEYKETSNYVRPMTSYHETYSHVQLGQGCTTIPWIEGTTPGRDYTNVELDKIVFMSGYLKFHYESRLDIEHDEKLSRVEVFSKTAHNPDQFKLLNVFDFQYEYFEGTAGRHFGPQSDFTSKRLKLKRVIAKSSEDVKEFDYKFDYQNESQRPDQLPVKTTFARDHWGFYNGKISSESLVPTYYDLQGPDTAPVQNIIGVMGDNRDANPSQTKLFSLQRIWYPTGGYTELELECHDFNVENSFTADFSFFNYNPHAKPNQRIFTRDGFNHTAQPSDFQQALQSGQVLDLRNAFTDRFGHIAETKITYFFRFRDTQSTCQLGGQTTRFELIKEDGTVLSSANIFELLNSPTPPSATCEPVSGSPGSSGFSGIKYVSNTALPRGRYFVRITIPASCTLFADVTTTIDYLESIGPMDYGGGLRVKRLKNYESASAIPIITRFEYNYQSPDENGDGLPELNSYGRRMVNPTYSYFSASHPLDCTDNERACFEQTCESLMRTSESTVSLDDNGSPVSYDQVTVYQGENGENGKTIFYYHNEPPLNLEYASINDLTGAGFLVPAKPPMVATITNPLCGLLKKQVDFRRGPGQFDTVRVVTNEYKDAHPTDKAAIWAVEKRTISSALENQCAKFENYLYPTQASTHVYATSTTEKTFDQFDQTKTTSNTTKFYYDNADHFQLTRQEEIKAGKTITRKFRYPADFPDGDCTAEVLAMKKDLFMHSAVIGAKTGVIYPGQLESAIGDDITIYGLFGNNKIVAPVLVASLKVNSPIPYQNTPVYLPKTGFKESEYRITNQIEYDNKGHVISVRKPDDMPVSYCWGYQDALPIAEVINARSNQVFYTSFEDWGEGDSNEGKTGSKSKLNNYSRLLNNLTPGAYLLTYWKKETGRWNYKHVPVTVTGTQYTINLTGNVDEVRFYPVGATMTTYICQPLVGITEIVDSNNISIKYEYDNFNRLQIIRDDKGNIVKKYTYNYKIK